MGFNYVYRYTTNIDSDLGFLVKTKFAGFKRVFNGDASIQTWASYVPRKRGTVLTISTNYGLDGNFKLPSYNTLLTTHGVRDRPTRKLLEKMVAEIGLPASQEGPLEALWENYVYYLREVASVVEAQEKPRKRLWFSFNIWP